MKKIALPKIEKKAFLMILAGIIFASLCLIVFWGFQKDGYYIDEFYTYTRANGTGIGVKVDVGQWNRTDSFISELASEGDENFRFGQVYKNCGFHPPVYHYMLHFVCSFFPGVFSKWLGIGLNMILMVLLLLLCADTAWRISGKDPYATLLATAVVAFAPATISGALFIRMYFGMALFGMWFMNLHVRNLEQEKLSVTKFLIPVLICGFLGFLTMYYFMIFMFIVTFFYCFYLFFCCKRYKDTVIYGSTVTLSLILAYFYFPVWVFYVFKTGGKSKKVKQNLISTDGDDIVRRIKFFYKLLNRHVFGGLLPVFIVLFVIGLIVLFFAWKKYGKIKDVPFAGRCMFFLGSTTVLYFLVMLKMTTKAMDTTHRYCFVVYPIFLMLMAIGVVLVFRRYERITVQPVIASALMMVLVVGLAYAQGQILYLNPSESDTVNFVAEHPDAKMVVFEQDNGTYDLLIYDCLQFDEAYFALVEKPETSYDDKIASAGELLVFVDSTVDQDECLQRIYDQNPNVSHADLLWGKEYSFVAYHVY